MTSKKTETPSTKMGTVRTAAPSRDGIATKGKTKGKQIVMPSNKSMKSGGKVKKMASGGMTASSRADDIASRGKTKCKMY